MADEEKVRICKGCEFPYQDKNVDTDIDGYCSQGCLRRKARNKGWKESSGITVLDFMKSRGEG